MFLALQRVMPTFQPETVGRQMPDSTRTLLHLRKRSAIKNCPQKADSPIRRRLVGCPRRIFIMRESGDGHWNTSSGTALPTYRTTECSAELCGEDRQLT